MQGGNRSIPDVIHTFVITFKGHKEVYGPYLGFKLNGRYLTSFVAEYFQITDRPFRKDNLLFSFCQRIGFNGILFEEFGVFV